ncbi:MAG TPA: AAA family ATPase, partial [Chloroflexota bacterium]
MPWLVPLPVQPTPLLGRARELEIIRRQLVDADARLLTLTGPPGVGKTRLALEAGGQVADRFPDGVTFIDLALVRDPARVLPMIAQALGIANRDGDPLLERLEAHLRDMRVLLILDIFERVLPAAIQLADLLATCPGLTMLVTSRIPLHLRWEQTLSIEPLTVPDLTSLPALEELAAVPAVALFLQRVLAVNSDLTLTADNAESVAQLVIHLDGLPLAIELAAARTPLLSPQMIVERLEQRLSLLHWEAPDIPERQHSLGSAVGWSYDLLDADDQALFRQLAVFAGGFDLEGAEGVVSVQPDGVHDVLQGLGSLVDKSLIQVKRQGEEEVRFELLESIREYALQQLDGHGELDSAARAHARYFLQLAEQADPHLRIRDQLVWYLRLDQECDNSRAALRWLLDHDEHESALRLAAALGFYWWTRGQGSEGWRWLAEAMEKAPGAAPALRTKALLTAGAILINEGNLGRSKGLLEEAGSLARARQDSSGVAEHLTYLGAVATFAGESTESARLLPQALSRWEELGNHFYIGLTLWYQAGAALMQGANEQASSLFSHALLQYDVIGDARMSSAIHLYLGLAMLNLDDLS